MALDNYANLLTSVVTWAMRTGDTEFAAAVPDMVTLLEGALNNGLEANPVMPIGISPLRVREMEAVDSITLTDGEGTLPADYLEFRTIRYGAHESDLHSADFEIVGNTIKVSRREASPLALGYYAKLPPLAQNDPNWLLEKAPNVYLFGTLLFAAPFMMDDMRMATWGQLFQSAVNGLVGSDMRSKYARANARVKGPTP